MQPRSNLRTFLNLQLYLAQLARRHVQWDLLAVESCRCGTVLPCRRHSLPRPAPHESTSPRRVKTWRPVVLEHFLPKFHDTASCQRRRNPSKMLSLYHLTLAAFAVILCVPSVNADDSAASVHHQLTFNTNDDHLPLLSSTDGDSHEMRYAEEGSAANSVLPNTLDSLYDALAVMQNTWYEVRVGSWPTAIDWTRAVLSTHLVATIAAFSRAMERRRHANETAGQHSWLDEKANENLINRFFAQNVYFMVLCLPQQRELLIVSQPGSILLR